ncbi:CGNR zinc finger domain-containing protein [Kribbella solani]|uniref:Putative RNA-binding Zn ribbon-like protein n=1 Tax=Kribbella solani TaxID=236067 RepID=A0A841DYX0_9ACTN|nr:CGNR zinc finger domain-containing protein [Kribbella solani]MBB5983171.1 putative RNA-binding Zn ribbon-like protein [Kribbella solani]
MNALPSHLELVRGVVLPKPVGAHPVLDFVNTRSEWTSRASARTEWLTSYEAFLIWNAYVGLQSSALTDRLIEQADPVEAARSLRTTLDFRSDLYDVLTGAAGNAFEPVARLVEKASGRLRLVRSDNKITWELPEDVVLPLHHLAVLAGELLTGASREYVRTCPSCGWLFLNPRGRRRWCSMATCGNRAKARAHAARVR